MRGRSAPNSVPFHKDGLPASCLLPCVPGVGALAWIGDGGLR
jgi:hypothetical protein